MSRIISTHKAENSEGKAVVKLDEKSGNYNIEYYDGVGNKFFDEDFGNKAVNLVEDKAEEWALGYKVLME